jgi:hypothetical protein
MRKADAHLVHIEVVRHAQVLHVQFLGRHGGSKSSQRTKRTRNEVEGGRQPGRGGAELVNDAEKCLEGFQRVVQSLHVEWNMAETPGDLVDALGVLSAAESDNCKTLRLQYLLLLDREPLLRRPPSEDSLELLENEFRRERDPDRDLALDLDDLRDLLMDRSTSPSLEDDPRLLE